MCLVLREEYRTVHKPHSKHSPDAVSRSGSPFFGATTIDFNQFTIRPFFIISHRRLRPVFIGYSIVRSIQLVFQEQIRADRQFRKFG